jgi:hypothetical protein
MSLNPAPHDEAAQIHALLAPLLSEADAGARRRSLLEAAGPLPARAWDELDQLIDALQGRLRADPRAKAREPTRPPRDVRPPSAPKVDPAPLAPRAEQEALNTAVTRRLPPPLPGPSEAPASPLPPLPEPQRKRPKTADELGAPPLPTAQVAPRTSTRRTSKSLPLVDPETIEGTILPARPGDSPETRLLYDDIVNLSAMSDRDGLVISLERLILLAKLEDHVRAFVESNEVKLMGIYESELKSFSRVPKRRPPSIENTMPRAFLKSEKVALVLPLCDGKSTITEITRRSPLSVIETCSVLSQLRRVGILEI